MRSARTCHRRAGYSLVEMMVTLAVGLILVSVALPTMIGAIQSYRLNSIAQQVGSLIDLARYTAIRRNTVATVQMKPVNGNTVFFIDLNNNLQPDTNEAMVVLPNDMQFANSQCPKPDPTKTPGLAAPVDFPGQITFDYRGTVSFPPGGQLVTNFLALGYTNQAQYGCRAVAVSPMGQTRLWKSPDGGAWIGM